LLEDAVQEITIMKQKLGRTLVALAAVATWAAPAAAATITFGEVPSGPLNGVTIGNVTFRFQIGGVDSLDATIGVTGPGLTVFNDPPNAEGNAAGILTMDFAVPIGFLQFGAHLSLATPVSPGLTVQFFDAALSPIGGAIPLNMVPSAVFAGGLFVGSAPGIARAVVDFNGPEGVRFAIDNVVHEQNVVPEPATLLLAGSGLAAAMGRRRAKSRR
jgi:hypothetical protein